MTYPSSKRCSRCGDTKAASDFNRHGRSRDGLDAWCRRCHTEYAREYRDRRRASDPEWHERKKAGHRAYRRRRGYSPADPHKVRARTAVSNAIKDRRLIPAHTCEDCGHDFSEFRREAHHEDYDKPLDVVWLCSLCHGKRHRSAA